MDLAQGLSAEQISPRTPQNLCTQSVARPGQGAYIADRVYIAEQPRGVGLEDHCPHT